MASKSAVFNGVSKGLIDMLADFAPLAEGVEAKIQLVHVHHLRHCA